MRQVRLIVCGGRDFSDQETLFYVLDGVIDRTSLLITGGAPGADSLAERWARLRCVPCYIVAADWEKHGKAAGPIRNKRMLELKPDMVIAFPGGKGTANMVMQARAKGVKVVELFPDGSSACA
jgi:hypothetical protein